jgi:hypothetical protein
VKQAIVRKTRRGILLGRASGQAAVEYILMVAIAVSLIFIMKGAFKGFADFIDNYLGKYTECLMAYGELPTLGISEDELKQHITQGLKCETGFKKFTLAEGRPPVDDVSTSGPLSRTQNRENGENSSGGGAGSAASKKSQKPSAPVQGGASAATAPGDAISRRGTGTSDGAAAANNKVTLIEDEGESRSTRREPRESRTNYRANDRYRAITGKQAAEIEYKAVRSTFKRTPNRRTVARAPDDSAQRGPKISALKPPPTKVDVLDDEIKDSGWGFGKMLKWILIIGMLVALIIFFGGQLMNYSNSDS